MHVRSLLIAVIAAVAALFAGVAAAVAEDPAPGAGAAMEQALCAAPDGTVVAAPAGTPPGPPVACPTGYPPSAAPAAVAEAPAADAPATAPESTPPPAPNPQPTPASSTAPPTTAPSSVTVEPQDVEPGDGIADPEPQDERRTTRPQTVAPIRPDRKPKPQATAAPKPVNPPSAPAVDDRPLVLAPVTAPRSVPNILLDRFEIPPFLLPLYQAAGVQYGVRWEILAAINSIETDYGRNLSVSSAGALGWMQFMPATWEMYGVDANGDGVKDPYNPVDAIFAAARYLKAAGAGDSLRRAIWAYNHADWYVNDVIARAEAISALPDEVVASLSGLTLGRFPIAARSTYAGRISTKSARAAGPNASVAVEGDGNRRGMRIYTRAGAAAIAVQDGVVDGMGQTKRLGKFVRLRDAYGNRYVYGHLATIAASHPVPRKRTATARAVRRELGLDGRDPKPSRAASAGRRGKEARAPIASAPSSGAAAAAAARLDRPTAASTLRVGEGLPLPAGVTSYDAWFAQPYTLDRSDVVLKPLIKGSRVIGGTILGRVGRASIKREGAARTADRRAERTIAAIEGASRAPHLWFEIRPAGSRTPRIDPKPILDGWRLLSATDVYRAKSSLVRGGGSQTRLSVGQILLMSKEQLQRHVLENPEIEIYGCGRQDIQAGIVDRRVLAALEFLVAKGMRPTVTSLRCGHGYYTASGNVSHHSFGSAVDIAAINGKSILGNQGPGSITDKAVRALLSLQGTMKPAQIITLMQYSGADNTYAMGDHADHIHLGFDPREDPATSVLRPAQWDRLIGSLARVPNPTVPLEPSEYSIAVTKPAKAGAHDDRDHR